MSHSDHGLIKGNCTVAAKHTEPHHNTDSNRSSLRAHSHPPEHSTCRSARLLFPSDSKTGVELREGADKGQEAGQGAGQVAGQGAGPVTKQETGQVAGPVTRPVTGQVVCDHRTGNFT